MAAPAESRPWNSIMRSIPGPTASRTAATVSTAASACSRASSFQAVPKGSNLRPR